MKYKVIVFLWCLVVSGGCKDALDIKPENNTTFANIDSEKDIESLLGGTGQLVRTMAYWNMTSAVVRGAYADEVNFSYKNVRQLDPSEVVVGQWIPFYNVIASANVVLSFIDQVPMTQERKDFYTGTACFYKALAYLELLRRWGDCVLMTGEKTIEWKPIAKSTWPKVADYAIRMAQDAVDKLPEWSEAVSSVGQAPRYRSTPCKGAANALLAHLCAWKAGCKYMALPSDRDYDERELWERAERACSAVIGSPEYELAANPELVCSQVLVGDSRESVYETVFKDLIEELPDDQRGYPFTMGRLYTSWPVMPTETESNIQQVDLRIKAETAKKMFPPGDLRRDAYFYRLDDEIEGSGGFAYPYKERSVYHYTEGWFIGQFENFNANRVWWRLSDIYLLRAESRARLGGDKVAGAIEDIDFVRDRANATRYSASEYNGDVQYAVFKERERELLMEGHRFYDIIRNGPEYVREFLEGGFKELTEQDYIEGAMFHAIWKDPMAQNAFTDNPLMRQNTWWAKRM